MKAKRILVALTASIVALSLSAQDEQESADEAAATTDSEAVEVKAEGEEAAKAPAVRKYDPTFTTLPLCSAAEGVAEILKPGAEEWAAVEIGHFYPLGASYRTRAGGKLVLAFSQDSKATIEGDASFTTRAQKLGEKVRGIVLGHGTLDIVLPDDLKEGSFIVSAPGFTVKDVAGESRYVYESTGDGDRATVRCTTGSLSLEGRHFTVPAMRAANEIVIRTSNDNLVTILYGTSGDYVVKLDQGVRAKTDIDDNGQTVTSVSNETLDWHLSPETKVVITRMLPAIGERMSVHTMAFDASGVRRSECAFCEGRAEINTGELVPAEAIKSEELAKAASEAEATTEAKDEDDAKSEDESSETTESADTSEE